jgi:hypothetical protein
MRFAAIACALLVICLTVVPGHAEKRVALVIGNDRYANLPADQQLLKAVNDSRAVGDALGQLGFEVIRGENLGRQALVDKFDEMTRKLLPGDVAFFFFAGHGVAIGGGNYILPADVPNVEPGQDTRLQRAALGESDLVSDLQQHGARVAMVVLDACRDNPFRRPGVRSVGGERGLARSEPARGVFTFYSAGLGQTALDRLGDGDSNPNSVFTRVLVSRPANPSLDLTALAIEVREKVAQLAGSIGHEQRPAYYDETIGGRIYLAGLSQQQQLNSGAPPSSTEAASQAAGYRTAAEAGDRDAMNNLGFMYQEGRGVAKDDVEAVRWFRKGAEAGNALAMNRLGFMYREGRGVAKNEVEAVRWYRKGAGWGRDRDGHSWLHV